MSREFDPFHPIYATIGAMPRDGLVHRTYGGGATSLCHISTLGGTKRENQWASRAVPFNFNPACTVPANDNSVRGIGDSRKNCVQTVNRKASERAN